MEHAGRQPALQLRGHVRSAFAHHPAGEAEDGKRAFGNACCIVKRHTWRKNRVYSQCGAFPLATYPSPRANDYRRRAEEADEMARTARDDAAKRTWADLAQQWRELARQANDNGW